MSLSVNSANFLSDHPATVAGVRINLESLPGAVAELVRRAKTGRGFTVFTLNLDHVVNLRRNSLFRAAYRRATHVTADGWPIVWLANRAERRVVRTTGADIVEPLCESAAQQDLPVYFVGPGEQARTGAIAALRRRIPSIRIAGAESPVVVPGACAIHARSITQRITNSGARICFVSLGAPKQELLADALSIRCPQVGFVCVGAAVDFISGSAIRAPLWMQRAGLEWLWRLAGEPRRLSMRYAACAYTFALLAFGAKTIPVEAYR